MAAPESLIAAIDLVIDYFNTRRLDLPDGFFDRKTQFVINGATFESLLSTAPNDPLVMMLARGPAGYRFTAKALQHAMPDAKVERGDVLTDGDPFKVTTKLWLSGKLRGSGEAINAVVAVALRLTAAGLVEVADAVVDPKDLDRIREARLRSG
jgi:hypothetical protein